MALAPCNSCRRHVRADELRCPFCGGAVGESTNRAVGRAPRVAVLFAGALGLAGCAGSAVDEGSPVAIYGAPFDGALVDTSRDDSRADTTATDSRADSATLDSATLDSATLDSATADSATLDSARADSADAADAVEADSGGAVPPYGAPLLDAGDD